jgi:hypothetical protein
MPVERFVAGFVPTPAVRKGRPQTHNRYCGIQPAHQSLFTDVLQVLPPPLREHKHRSVKRRPNALASNVDSGHTVSQINFITH